MCWYFSYCAICRARTQRTIRLTNKPAVLHLTRLCLQTVARWLLQHPTTKLPLRSWQHIGEEPGPSCANSWRICSAQTMNPALWQLTRKVACSGARRCPAAQNRILVWIAMIPSTPLLRLLAQCAMGVCATDQAHCAARVWPAQGHLLVTSTGRSCTAQRTPP